MVSGEEFSGLPVEITLPNGEVLVHVLGQDDVISIKVGGAELIGIFGGSGAGWWPTGDGGESNADWTPLRAATTPGNRLGDDIVKRYVVHGRAAAVIRTTWGDGSVSFDVVDDATDLTLTPQSHDRIPGEQEVADMYTQLADAEQHGTLDPFYDTEDRVAVITASLRS